MIHEQLEKANKNPEDNYRLAFTLEGLVNIIESENGASDQANRELEEAETTHPIYDYIEALQIWEESGHKNFENGARRAMESLEKAYRDARSNNWESVAVFCLKQLIEFKEKLDCFSPSKEIGEVVEFLESEYVGKEEVHLGNFSGMVEAVQRNLSEIEEDLVERAIDICKDRAKHLRDKGRYHAERDYLMDIIKFKKHLSEDSSDEGKRIVKSLEEEADGTEDKGIEAHILESGISAYENLIPEEKKKKWLSRIRKLNRESIDEMSGIGVEIPTLELEFVVDSIVSKFEAWKEVKGKDETLESSLFWEDGYPEYKKSIERAGKHPVSKIAGRKTISPEGDAVALKQGGLDVKEEFPSTYSFDVKIERLYFSKALEKLIEEEKLNEEDFLGLVDKLEELGKDDRKMLQRVISNHFEEKYPEALHMGAPTLERTVVRALEEMGEAVTKNVGEEYEQRGLGGLFNIFEDEIDQDFGKYLKYMYTEKSGFNLRNRICHGQLQSEAMNFYNSIILIFDTFRALFRILEYYRNS